jgi:NTE family protein
VSQDPEAAERAARPMRRLRALLPARHNGRRSPSLNLALQGGGAHGAFTWGVLDALLERGHLAFDGVSGASAGAINAVAFAAGLMEDGPAGARVKLAEVWEAIAATVPPVPALPDEAMFGVMTRLVSPYDFNPFDFDPLRDALARTIDFAALRRHCPVHLYVAATDIADGRPRLFTAAEITRDVVLASICLPQLRRAIRIGERHYWDGGYSANPPLLPLVYEREAADTLIVLIDPPADPEVPTSAPAISRRLGRLVFNAPLRREIELIEGWRALANGGLTLGGGRRKRLRRHRFHLIEAGEATAALEPLSKLVPDWRLLERLRGSGRAAAQAWVERHGDTLGVRSSVDLAARFL